MRGSYLHVFFNHRHVFGELQKIWTGANFGEEGPEKQLLFLPWPYSYVCSGYAVIKLGPLQEHFDCTSKTSNMYGTIPWAAPEVLRQEKACRESDIW